MRLGLRVLLIAIVLIAAALFVADWRFWLRYLNSPDNPVAEIDWFTPLVEVGTPEVENLQFAEPDERVFTEASLQAATDYAKSMQSYALLVSHRGVIQWEHYGPGFDAERMTDSQSMHKPLVPLLLGAAIADGYIGSVDEPVSQYLSEWRDDPRGEMTLRDLLYMESGLDQPVVDPSPFAPGTRAFMTSHIEKAILNLDLKRPPGTSLDFNFLTTQLLSLIIERATDQPYADYFRERFWSRIGGGRARLRLDRPGGNAHTFCCIHTTARGWARVGELVLGEGRWGDEQILPASWIGQMRTTSRGPQFGMHIWLLDGNDTERVFSEVRERGSLQLAGKLATPIIFFEGRGGQRVYILPALQTVVVRTGEVRWDWDDVAFINGLAAGFTGESVTPPPDYDDAAAWAALPEREDAADFAPPGEQDRQAEAAADVFFIHPTTFFNPREWHAAIDDPRVSPVTDSVVKGQASAFNDCCAVYAPRYRQASLKALMDRSGRGTEAYDLAYADVQRAFAAFAARSERPFIIAGHSQGALHALRLSAEVAEREAWRERLVAAYVVGIGIPQARYQDDLSRLEPCRDAAATGCVVSWNSFGPEADASRWRAAARARSAELIERSGNDAIQCDNPLDWASADAVAVVPSPGTAPLAAASELTGGAACDDGALVLARAPGAVFKPLAMPGGIWHLGDFALFYQAVRANASTRVAAFTSAD